MKYCKACGVNIDDGYEKCPLCHAEIGEAKGELHYPVLNGTKSLVPKLPRTVKGLILLFIIIGGVSVLVNAYYWEGLAWSAFVVGGALFVWLLLYGIYVAKWNFGASILLYLGSVSALLVMIELVSETGGWARNIAIPALIVAAILLEMINLAAHRKRWRENLIYCFMAAVFGFIPLPLYFAGIMDEWWAVCSCAIISGATIALFVVFGVNSFKNEMSKRFHF